MTGQLPIKMPSELLASGQVDFITPLIYTGACNAVSASVERSTEKINDRNKAKDIDPIKAEDIGKTISMEQYCNSVHTTTCYSIFFTLYEVHHAVERMIEQLKGYSLYRGIKGYKRELNRLEAFHNDIKTRENMVQKEFLAEISTMCKMSHEDLALNVTRIQFSVSNAYLQSGFANAEILAPIETAYIVTEFATKYIEKRIDEGLKYSNALRSMKALRPQSLLDCISKFDDFVMSLVGTPNCNLNKCRDLHIGVKVMDNYLSDVKRMTLIAVKTKEMSMGAQWVIDNYGIENYLAVHPELAPAPQEEIVEAEIIEEVEEEKEEMSLEEMFKNKGWKVN